MGPNLAVLAAVTELPPDTRTVTHTGRATGEAYPRSGGAVSPERGGVPMADDRHGRARAPVVAARPNGETVAVRGETTVTPARLLTASPIRVATEPFVGTGSSTSGTGDPSADRAAPGERPTGHDSRGGTCRKPPVNPEVNPVLRPSERSEFAPMV